MTRTNEVVRSVCNVRLLSPHPRNPKLVAFTLQKGNALNRLATANAQYTNTSTGSGTVLSCKVTFLHWMKEIEPICWREEELDPKFLTWPKT
ncbi:hypothetical protein N7494_007179 [Penicillium frequentans]|uniref:Uncharacterized protein n=1 Tax=Penicillium frequentans TaxID=3151616 RepID=A0AAD6GD88_9EURO|nr:hypothetical protein N7494_007179 [Penicillium glabrum]